MRHIKLMQLIENITIENKDFTKEVFEIAEYEICTFINCNFNEVVLSGAKFYECIFDGCNLSLIKVAETSFTYVAFNNCKMMGIQFGDCRNFLFEISCKDCFLTLSSFYQVNLKNSSFESCNLKEVDFTESNLVGLYLNDCDLFLAIFDNTIIEKTDFTTAVNYNIDLSKNEYKGAKFAETGIKGLLGGFNIEII